jgi:membrane-associated protein
MIPGLDATELIRAFGVLGVMAIIFAESGLLLGFFFPGDTLMFSAGFLATKGIFGVSIHVLVMYLIIAAILGEAVGYFFGHRVGHRIFRKKDSLLFHPDNLVKAEKFYEKYGPVTILLARFIPVVRTFVPIVAGATKMNQRIFTLYNVLGAVLWVSISTYTGYFAGDFLERHGINIDSLILPIVGIVALLTMGSPLLHILKDKESREQFFKKFKRRSRY